MKQFEGFVKGINLGGWISQCGEQNYNKNHYDAFIKEENIKQIASWGLDHIRLPIDYNVLQNEDGTFIDWGFSYIDNCILWCEKYGLNIVLDLHKAPGYVFDDKTYCQFFDDQTLQEKYINLWKELTNRYAKKSPKIAFELLNEVTALETAQKWNKIADKTIEEIRNINKDVKIIIGGIYNSSIFGLTLLEKPHDENIVFTFHCYSPMIFTHQDASWVEKMPRGYKIPYPIAESKIKAESLKIFGNDFDDEFIENPKNIGVEYFERMFKVALKISEKYRVPLYCGEYGVIDKANPNDALNWFKDIHCALHKHNISRAAWTYKEKDFGFIDEHYKSVLNELVKEL